MSIGKELNLDCKKKTPTSANRWERPLIRKTGSDGVPQKERERQMDRNIEKERGGMQCFMKKEDKR